MPSLLLICPALAAVLLAAHFYRAGQWGLAALSLALIALAAVPRRWAARTVQAALVLGAVEWLRTLAVLVAQRLALQQPWGRLALILVAVAVFTAASALVWRQQTLRRWARIAP